MTRLTAPKARVGSSMTTSTPVASARDPEVRLPAHPTPEWFGAMGALQNHTIEQNRIYRRIVARSPSPPPSRRLRSMANSLRWPFGALHNRLLCYES